MEQVAFGNSEIRPLLYDSKLTIQAIGTELGGADFANAVLINSDLSHQVLREANFHEANLGRANLRGADLTEANFCRTDLYETNLQDARLNQANLQGAQLAKTMLAGAEVIECTVLRHVRLGSRRGWNTAAGPRHQVSTSRRCAC